MKVAIMCNGFSSKGFDREELVDNLNKKGYDVYLGLINDGIINKCYNELNAKLIFIDANRNNTNPFIELKSLLNIKNKLKKENIDYVIIYGIKNHISMILGAKIAGVKKIMCVVNGRGNLFILKGLKWDLVRAISLPMLKLSYRLADFICFQNNDDRKEFIDKGLVKNTSKVFLTGGSGVNLEKFKKLDLVNENSFLFLSRITESKWLKEYIYAAKIVKKKYPTAVFDVVGPLDNAVEKSSLNDILKKAEDENTVIYHGETRDVSKWMAKSRFFIYPSYYPEGVPRSVLQALASGRPVITFNTPGCKETVKNGVNGFVVEKKDIKALAEKMIWMIEHPKETENMAKESRKFAEDNFDVFKINENIINRLK